MSNFLAPKVNANVGFEQPVATPSLVGGVADLASGLLRAAPAPAKPTATELKSSALQPFMKRLDDLRNSDLSDQDFLRHARQLGRQWGVSHPEYQDDISTALEGYGVSKPTEIFSMEDQYTQGMNEWSQTTQGQYAILQAQTVDANGQLDMEATTRNLNVLYQEHLAERAAIESTAQEMELVNGNQELWKTQSNSKMEVFIPQWTKKTNGVVESLFSLIASGDPAVDEYTEQMAFLRDQRRILLNEYQLEAQSAGLHSSTYKGEGAENLAAALSPLDEAIAMGENLAADPGKGLAAFKSMHEAGALQEGIEAFGPLFVMPEFQRALFGIVGEQAFGDKTAKYIEGLKSQNKVGGISLLQGRISVEDAQTVMRISEEDGTVKPEAVVETATETINSPAIPKEDPRDASVAVSHQYKMLRVANKLLGPSVLSSVYNSLAVRNVAALVAGGTEEAEAVRQAYVDFAAEQVRMNMIKIEAELESFNPNMDVDVQLIDGELFFIQGGARVPATGELAKAIRNVNTISANSKTILGLEEKKPDTNLNRKSLRNVDEVKKYLEGVDQESTVEGGDGQVSVGGGEAGDRTYQGDAASLLRESEGFRSNAYWDVDAWRAGYGSDTVTRADGSVERVTETTVVTREDAERDLARRTQEFNSKARAKVGAGVWDTLPGNVTDALLSVAYNYGSIPNRLMAAIQSRDTELIAQAVEGLAGDNGGINANRRRKEAAVIRGQATAPRGAAPYYTPRPKLPGEDTGQRDTVVTESIRPQARPQSAGADLSGQVTLAQATTPAEGEKRPSTPDTEPLKIQTEKLLKRLGIDPEDVPNFTSEEDVRKAIENGDIGPDDVIILNGQIIVL